MNGGTDNRSDPQFCWEQIGKGNPAFRISRVFASRREAERLLPLYALFSSIEQICSSITDEDVARSKLNWWRMECLQHDPARSRHPVLRELDRTGVRLGRDSLVRLFDDADARLDGIAPPDLDGLRDLCVRLHRPQVELELGASGWPDAADGIDDGCSASAGLLQLIRESAGRSGRGRFWWIPMNLLARHGVSREQLRDEPGSAAGGELLTDVVGRGAGWGGALPRARKTESGRTPYRHLLAIGGLYAGKLKRLARTTPDRYPDELGRQGLPELIAAWKGARRA